MKILSILRDLFKKKEQCELKLKYSQRIDNKKKSLENQNEVLNRISDIQKLDSKATLIEYFEKNNLYLLDYIQVHMNLKEGKLAEFTEKYGENHSVVEVLKEEIEESRNKITAISTDLKKNYCLKTSTVEEIIHRIQKIDYSATNVAILMSKSHFNNHVENVKSGEKNTPVYGDVLPSKSISKIINQIQIDNNKPSIDNKSVSKKQNDITLNR